MAGKCSKNLKKTSSCKQRSVTPAGLKKVSFKKEVPRSSRGRTSTEAALCTKLVCYHMRALGGSQKGCKHAMGEKLQAEKKQLNVMVRHHSDSDLLIPYKMGLKSPMGFLLSKYHSKMDAQLGSFRFHFEGKRITPSDTPKSRGMEDGDIIDTFVIAIGGCL